VKNPKRLPVKLFSVVARKGINPIKKSGARHTMDGHNKQPVPIHRKVLYAGMAGLGAS
jgi:hypothetical protein